MAELYGAVSVIVAGLLKNQPTRSVGLNFQCVTHAKKKEKRKLTQGKGLGN